MSGTSGGLQGAPVRFGYSAPAIIGRAAFAIVSIPMAVFLVHVAVVERSTLGIFGALAVVIGAMVGVGMVLSCFSITIDDSGIFASALGVRGAGMRWEDVARIKLVRSAFLGSTSAGIQIQSRQAKKFMALLPNVWGHITFSDQIYNFPDLVERINCYAALHHIAMIVVDLRQRSQTPGVESGTAGGVSGKARSQEANVDRFDVSGP